MADNDFTLKGKTEIEVDKRDLDAKLKSAAKEVDGFVKQVEDSGKRVKSVFDFDTSKVTKGMQDTTKALEQESKALDSIISKDKSIVELEKESARYAEQIKNLQSKIDYAKNEAKPKLEKRLTVAEVEKGVDSTAYKKASTELDALNQRTNEYIGTLNRLQLAKAANDAQLENKRAMQTSPIQPDSIADIERALNAYDQLKGKLSETATEYARVLQAQMESSDKTSVLTSKKEELREAYRGLTNEINEYVQAEKDAKEQQAEMDMRKNLGIEKFGNFESELVGIKQTITGLATMYANLSKLPAPEFTSELMGLAEMSDNVYEHLKHLETTWRQFYTETAKGLSGTALDEFTAKAQEAEQGLMFLFQEINKLPQMQFAKDGDANLEQQIASLKAWRDELGRVISEAPQNMQGALQSQIESTSRLIDELSQKLQTIRDTNRARGADGDIAMSSTAQQLGGNVQRMRDHLTELETKLVELKQRMADFNSGKIELSDEEFVKLKQDIATTVSNIASAKQQIASFGETAKASEFSIIQLIQRLNELKTQRYAMDKAGTDKSSQEYQNIERQINNAEAGIRQYYNELNSTAQATNGVTASTERLASSVRGIASSKAGLTIGDVFKSVEDGAKRGLRAVLQLLSAMKSLAGGIISKIKNGFDKIGGSAEKAFSSKALKRNLTTLLKYTIGVRSLYFAFRRLRSAVKEGIDNLVQFQSATNETNAQMTEFKTSMLYLKNAWGAAFAPIINVVMPILTTFMDALASVGNAIARFIAALTGQSTVIQALKVSVGDYAQSLGGAGSSAKKAADEQKKLNDRLAAFDDLNVLGKDKDDEDTSPSGGGGGGGNVPSINEMFERIETPVSRLAELLKTAWDTGNGYNLGFELATSLSEGFDKAYQWLTGEGYAKAMKIANLIGTFFDGILDVDDLGTNFGKMFGAAVVLGLDFINTIITPERMYKVGVRIAEALNEAIPMIVPKLGTTLGNLFSSAINGLYGFLTTSDFVAWGKSFGEAINNFFKKMGETNSETGKTGWETLGANIHEAIHGALQFALSALEELDTQEIIDAIHEFVEGLNLEPLIPTFKVLLKKIWDIITELIEGSPELQKLLNTALKVAFGAVQIGAGISVAKLVGGVALQGAVSGLFSRGIASAFGGRAVSTAAGEAMASTAVSGGISTAIRTGFSSAKTSITNTLSSAFGGMGDWLFGGFGRDALATSRFGSLGIGSGLAGVLDVGAGALGIATIVQGVQGIGNRIGDIVYDVEHMDVSPWEAFVGGLGEVGSSIAGIPDAISTISELDMSFSDLAEGARIAWDEIAHPEAAEEGVEWAQNIINANQGIYDSYTDWDGIEEARQERVRNMLNGMQEDYANYYGRMGREAVGIAQSIDYAYQTLADNEAQRERERQDRVQGILTANSITEGQRSIAEYYQMLGEAELLQERVDTINQGYREMADRYRDLAQRENLIDSMNDSYREMAERAAETARQSTETSNSIANSFEEASASVTASAETMERESANKFASIGNAFNTEIQDKAIPVATTVTDKFSQSFIAVGEASKQGATAISENFGMAFENIDQNATDTWTSIKETLSEGGDVFMSFSDGMSNTMKVLLNGLIDGINMSVTKPLQDLTNALNTIRNLDVDGNKPFAGIPYLKVPTIPHLAQGAVIPPNKEFMAVLGDQTSGTNIEAPLDTIRQAVGDELTPYLQQLIEINAQVITAINNKNLTIGDRQIGQANARYTARQNMVRGTSM